MNLQSSTPVWLTVTQIQMLHSESIRLFGGRPGIRDINGLESALARPKNLFMYSESPDIFQIAAEYAHGIARTHPFVDGNKRAVPLAIRSFLFLNGNRFSPDPIETVTMIEGIAGGTEHQKSIAEWIKGASTPSS